MRLLCINNKPIPELWNNPEALALIKEGKEYEGELTTGFNKGVEMDGYFIPAFNKKYVVSRFIQLSNLDETELVTEDFEEKYCIPVKL